MSSKDEPTLADMVAAGDLGRLFRFLCDHNVDAEQWFAQIDLLTAEAFDRLIQNEPLAFANLYDQCGDVIVQHTLRRRPAAAAVLMQWSSNPTTKEEIANHDDGADDPSLPG
ncbi:MAG TPA: hypothetical protein VG708_00400 [Mycobacteriales bacterium]|jgi:hypothetical protein|nr:hypothetical protein [Mycobacteriales bacterium]